MDQPTRQPEPPMRRWAPAVLLLATAGCPPPAHPLLDPIPIDQAVAVVNANTGKIGVCLRAQGSASGHFVADDGRRHPFDLRAVFFVLPPRHFYMTLKHSLGSEELLLGSNDLEYWLHIRRDDDTYRYGTHAAIESADLSALDTAGRGQAGRPALPLRPDMVIEALGLNGLPDDTTGTAGPVQRIDDEHQQLIFLAYTTTGQGVIRKEYWLDRREPRLIRRILFRDGIGRVAMDSRLDEYRPLGSDGPLLPGRVAVEWPLQGGRLDLKVDRWQLRPDRGPDHPAFVAPHHRGETFRHMIDLDFTVESTIE